MPRRDPKLVGAATRAAEGRRIVAGQQLLIETLKASGKPSQDAEVSLQLYVSAQHLPRDVDAIEDIRLRNDNRFDAEICQTLKSRFPAR